MSLPATVVCGWQCGKVSAPAVDRHSAPVPIQPLPWPLRVLAAIGRLVLRLRRFLRHQWRRLAALTEKVGRSPAAAGPIAALSVSVVGLAIIALPVAGAWWGGVEPPGPWHQAAAVTGSVWVMAHGVPIRLLGVDYSLIPWGLLLIPAWLGHQAGRWLVRIVRPRRLITAGAAWGIAVTTGAVIVAAVSVVADIPDVQTSARRALIAAVLVGAIAVGSGVWRSSDVVRAATARIPALITVTIRAAGIAVAALLTFASVLLLVAVASSFGEIANVFGALSPTVFDSIVLSALSLAYVPTMIIWALAYLLGAGVTFGPDVLFSPFVPAVTPASLPVFPPLAALPETSAPLVWAFPALTVLAGGLAGLAVSRFAFREGPLVRIALGASASVLAAGVVWVLLVAGTGSLGDGRLLAVGPDPALGALLAGVGLAVGALPTSVLRAKRRARRLQPVELKSQAAKLDE